MRDCRPFATCISLTTTTLLACALVVGASWSRPPAPADRHVVLASVNHLGPPASAPSEEPVAAAAPEQEAEAWSLRFLNDAREEAGVPEVSPAEDLTRFARDWSERMSEIGMQHSNQSARRALIDGDRTAVGENVAWLGDESLSPPVAAARLQQLWRESPGHYINQIRPAWTEVGVGLHHDESGWWATHVFADG